MLWDYSVTRFADPEALEDTATTRNVMKGCLDNHVIQRCKMKLQSARNVNELFWVLKDQENFFASNVLSICLYSLQL